MSINYVLGGFATFSKLRSSSDDDWVDRLCHIYTVIILTIFAIFVGYGQYLGSPIECYTPAEYNAAWVAYVKSKCWIMNTYYISIDEDIPNQKIRKMAELPYYQWIPIVLLFMALMCKLPSVAWRLLNGATGINLDKIVNMATDTQLCPPDKSDETIKNIASYIDRWLQANRDYHWNICVRIRHQVAHWCCCMCGKRDGLYLTRLYLAIKLLYFTVFVGLIFLLNVFMGDWYHLYGFELFNNAADNKERQSRFPTDTLCDLTLRKLGQHTMLTVQCFLPYNILNEKIFGFIWFWFVFVSIVVAVNFAFWTFRNCSRMSRFSYIKKYLKVMDELHGEGDRKLARRFAEQYLRSDGVFVLRVVGKNSNEIVLGAIVRNIWRLYKTGAAMEDMGRHKEGGDYMV